MLDTLTGDITNKTNAYYAGAGRDLSGANAQNLTRGLASGLAPALLGQYNQNIQNQLGAAGSLYGAANTTGGLLSGLSQTALANQGTGVDAATAALAARDSPYNQLLAIQSAAQGIPLRQPGATLEHRFADRSARRHRHQAGHGRGHDPDVARAAGVGLDERI